MQEPGVKQGEVAAGVIELDSNQKDMHSNTKCADNARGTDILARCLTWILSTEDALLVRTKKCSAKRTMAVVISKDAYLMPGMFNVAKVDQDCKWGTKFGERRPSNTAKYATE